MEVKPRWTIILNLYPVLKKQVLEGWTDLKSHITLFCSILQHEFHVTLVDITTYFDRINTINS